jgi:hypothetical protein
MPIKILRRISTSNQIISMKKISINLQENLACQPGSEIRKTLSTSFRNKFFNRQPVLGIASLSDNLYQYKTPENGLAIEEL